MTRGLAGMRYYIIVMAILAALTALFAMPGIATVALVVTFGLAMPLVLSVTAFVYGLCFYPLFAVWHVARKREPASGQRHARKQELEARPSGPFRRDAL